MAASVNKVIIVGTLGRDPEVRYLPSGDAMCNISVATSDKWKDKTSGEQKEQTEWHKISFFGKLAEIVGKFALKGTSMYIEGSLHTRKYTDKDGVEKYSTEIKGNSMQLLGGGKQSDAGGDSAPAARPAAAVAAARQKAQQQAPAARPQANFSDMDDDIPF